MATTLKDIANSAIRSPLSIQGIVANAGKNSGTNDTARSPESVQSSNVVIPADQLGQTTQIPSFAPAPEQSSFTEQLDSITNQAQQIQQALPTATNEARGNTDVRGQIQQGVSDMFNRDIAKESGDIRDSYGLQAKEQLARELGNEATALKRDYEAQIRELQKNPEGKLRGALQAETNDLTIKANLALSEKMFQYSIANGDFQQADKLAQQAIGDLERADARKLKLFETAYNFVQNDLSESEKLQVQQNFQAQQDERNFEQNQLMAEFNYNLGAGQRAFENSLKARNLQLTEAKFAQEMADRARELNQEANDDGIVPFKNENQVASAQAQIDTIDNLKTHKGKSKAVGVFKLGRFTPFKVDVGTGEVADYIGDIDALTKDMTIDNLINTKAEGGTFGALNIEELKLLAESATKINGWRRQEQQGDDLVTTHYSVSEKKMDEELDKISAFRKLDFVLKGGDPASVGIKVEADGSMNVINSDGSVTQIRE